MKMGEKKMGRKETSKSRNDENRKNRERKNTGVRDEMEKQCRKIKEVNEGEE